jgi:NAD(P)-dependent dehydrogenase (short-subunit alcohol dehydrogenase family)
MSSTNYFAADLLKGKTAFITGGGSGINLGIAKNFAALGADVAICGRSQDKLDAASEQLRSYGVGVCAVATDVRDIKALDAALATTRTELGPVDILVCGAAGNFLAPAEQLSANGFKTVIDIDLIGSFNAARAAFEQLRETRGCIIFLSAGQAFTPYALQVHAGAAKAGIDNMMKNLALEWGRYGIRCNSIAPGPIAETEGMKRLVASSDSARTTFVESVPLRRLGNIDDIAHAACFLAAPTASYITGCLIVVDGGQNLPGSAPFNLANEQTLSQTDAT